MAYGRGPVAFLLGPSGVGKSTLADWLKKDAGFLHVEIDRFPDGDGIDLADLRSEWDSFLAGAPANPLVAKIRLRLVEAKATGAVLSFPSRLVLRTDQLGELRGAGVASLVLYGSAADCLDGFLRQEKTRKRVDSDLVDFWLSNNCHSYFEFSRPEFAPFRVAVFRNGDRVPRAELVAEVQRRAAARPNPRLQRTPSASPPSPLSRKPLGSAWEMGA